MLHRITESWIVAILAAIGAVGCGSSARTSSAVSTSPYAATITRTATVTATATATAGTQSSGDTTGGTDSSTSDASATDTTDTTDTEGSLYRQTCAIKAWYSTIDLGMVATQYIHFKCVDEATGTTVAEAPGSDNIDASQEAQGAVKNSAREALVNALESKLEADGWHLIGASPGGLWYELRLGR